MALYGTTWMHFAIIGGHPELNSFFSIPKHDGLSIQYVSEQNQ